MPTNYVHPRPLAFLPLKLMLNGKRILTPSRFARRGLTLIELVVVLTILVALVADLLFAVLRRFTTSKGLRQ